MKLVALADSPLTADGVNVALRYNLKNVVRFSDEVTVYNSSVGGLVTAQHNLNAVPDFIFVRPKIDARWWVDDDDRTAWSATTIVFHASHLGQYVVRAGYVAGV